MTKNVLLKITLLPLFLLLSFGVFQSGLYLEEKFKHSTEIVQDDRQVLIDSISEIVDRQDVVKEKLISEAKNYILKSVPKADSNVDIIVPHIVDQSLGNNIDLCFILAQCKIETAFGTTGMGRTTSKKSMFGINKTYRTYEECIDHYIANLKKNYLSTRRDIHNLMSHYVTHNGHRYAEDPKYEYKMQSQYKEIKEKTDIEILEQEYKELSTQLDTLQKNLISIT